MELIALGCKKMGYFGMLIIISEWLFLTITHTHYVIDMITAVVVAMTAHRCGEYIVYFSDVLILRFRKARRQPYWYIPCARCGWNVSDANMLVFENEIKF